MLYQCRKKENCFSGAQVYEYRLLDGLNAVLLEVLGAAGDLTVKKISQGLFFRLCLKMVQS